MPSQTINIKNQSGSSQNYTFYASPPSVSGGQTKPIWQSVLKTAANIPNGGNFRLSLPGSVSFITGTYGRSANSGSMISVTRTMPVKLGTSGSGGAQTIGSTVKVIIEDGGENVDVEVDENGQGKMGALSVEVSGHVTQKGIENNTLFIGLGMNIDGNISPMATFTPFPNSHYQIMPNMEFNVAPGERFQTGQLIKSEMFGQSAKVDFNTRGTDTVTVVHQEDGTMAVN